MIRFELDKTGGRAFALLLLAFAGPGLAAGTPQDIRVEAVLEGQATAFDGAYCSFEIPGRPAGNVIVYNSEFAWARIDGQQQKFKADPPGPIGRGKRTADVFRADPISLTVSYRETGRGEGGFSAKGTLLVRKGDSTRRLRIEGGCAD